MAAAGHNDGGAFVTVVLQGPEQAFLMQPAEVAFGRERTVSSHPQRGQVGDGAAGAHGAQGVAGVMHPFTVKGSVFFVHQAVDHAQDLAFHGRKGLGGLGFHQVLVQGDHDLRQRQHEIRQGRGHVTDERGGGGVDRVGHQFIEQELGLLRDEHRFLGDGVVGEVFFDVRQIPFNRDDVLLQEAGEVAGDVLVDATERGFRGFGHRKYAVHRLDGGLGGFFLSGHRCHT